MLVLTNDLNDRDEQIILLKKKEQHYEQTLIDRDNMYKQDAMVRMQLGKRLEQVLMDKEEALEQLEMMKVVTHLMFIFKTDSILMIGSAR